MIDRIAHSLLLGASAGLLLAPGILEADAGSSAPLRPNIVLILCDDLGWGDMGPGGQEMISTPNIDRLAAEGRSFSRHYAGSTVCAPSRAVLMSGLHLGHCPVNGNSSPAFNPDEVTTVAEVLRGAGYRTACFGKWGIGNPPPLDDPGRQGFDRFYGYVNMFHAHNFFPPFMVSDGEKVPLANVLYEEWNNPPEGKDGYGVAEEAVDYAPEFIRQEMLGWLDQAAATTAAAGDSDAGEAAPFFLYYALNIPHANNEGGKHGEARGMEVDSYGEFADRDWPDVEKGFAAMIRRIDDDVALILEKLAEHGIDEDTVVMFSSDNGPHEEGGHKHEFFDSNAHMRGMKRDLYDGGIHVPLIVRWPEKVEPGSSTAHLSGFQDFLPTCAELAGAQAPEGLDGISYLPALTGEGEQPQHEYLYWNFGERGGAEALVMEDWKLIATKNPQTNLTRMELYHLLADPSETEDRAKDFPERFRHMLKLMREANAGREVEAKIGP